MFFYWELVGFLQTIIHKGIFCINLLRLQYSLLKFTAWTCIEPRADSRANFFYTVQGKQRDQYTQEFDNKYNHSFFHTRMINLPYFHTRMLFGVWYAYDMIKHTCHALSIWQIKTNLYVILGNSQLCVWSLPSMDSEVFEPANSTQLLGVPCFSYSRTVSNVWNFFGV